jgi:hypothetical protein
VDDVEKDEDSELDAINSDSDDVTENDSELSDDDDSDMITESHATSGKHYTSRLDGEFWNTQPTNRSLPTRKTWKDNLDQKLITRLEVIVALFERAACRECAKSNITSSLSCVAFSVRCQFIEAACSTCGETERVYLANSVTLCHSDGKGVPDIQYLFMLAVRFLPGGGYASLRRISNTIGLPTPSKPTFTEFCNGPLLTATKLVFAKSRDDFLNTLKTGDAFPSIRVKVDTRWSKRWGFNSLYSTTRLLEANSDMVCIFICLKFVILLY